jgi:hypothetical protein
MTPRDVCSAVGLLFAINEHQDRQVGSAAKLQKKKRAF